MQYSKTALTDSDTDFRGKPGSRATIGYVPSIARPEGTRTDANI